MKCVDGKTKNKKAESKKTQGVKVSKLFPKMASSDSLVSHKRLGMLEENYKTAWQ